MEVSPYTPAPASDMLVTGHAIGSYTLLSRLGAGGHGRGLSRPRSKLGRDVAIKVLPRRLRRRSGRLARFEREARVLASLNHPHIGAIYGLEDVDGYAGARSRARRGGDARRADRRRGRSSPAEALTDCRQIAEALDAAHEKGHRAPRPEAGQHQDHARRRRQGARLRARQSGCRQRRSAPDSRNRQPSR